MGIGKATCAFHKALAAATQFKLRLLGYFQRSHDISIQPESGFRLSLLRVFCSPLEVHYCLISTYDSLQRWCDQGRNGPAGRLRICAGGSVYIPCFLSFLKPRRSMIEIMTPMTTAASRASRYMMKSAPTEKRFTMVADSLLTATLACYRCDALQADLGCTYGKESARDAGS